MNADLLRAELLKLRTTRALLVTAAVLALFTTGAALLAVLSAGSSGVPALDEHALTRLSRLPAQVTAAACLVLGVLSVGGEHRHRTRVLSALAVPRRGRLLTAQLAAVAVASLGLALLTWVVALVSGIAALVVTGEDIPWAAGPLVVLVGAAAASALLGVLGGALAGAVGGTTGALGLAAGWFFVVEGVLPVLLRRPELAERLPGGALSSLVAAGPASAGPIAPAAGALVLAAMVALLAAAATAAGSRREL